jgi:hypothetical protein
VWTPLVGLCSISCGRGENLRTFVKLYYFSYLPTSA